MQVFEPVGHAGAVRSLWHAAEVGRLPHALCFEGPEGIGKFRAALWFAAGLLCSEGPGEPCGACGPCKRVSSGGAGGNHPDLLVIDPIEELAELAAACRQLLADSSEEITEQIVDRYYGGRVETSAFAVADAAIAGRHGEALRLLRHALATGADPVPMVAAFASKVRTMAKLAGARGSAGDLARQFGLAPWQVERARRDLSGWDDAGLGRAIQALASADAQVKGAGRDPVFALEHLVGVIAARGRA